MVLDYYTVGRMYWDFCVYNRQIDLNKASKNIYDTCAYLVDTVDSCDDIEGGGNAHMLYAISSIFGKVLNTEGYHRRAFPSLFENVPEDTMRAMISRSNRINKPLIEKGITPSDLFERPRTGGVDYWQ